MAVFRTIVLKGDLAHRHDEAPASAALSPGHMVELMSTGLVRKNTIVAGNIPIVVAKEDDLLGRTINIAYAAGDLVSYHIARKGDVLHFRVAASAAAIVKGDRLEPVTGGTIQKLASGVAIALAEEAVDNSAGGSEVFLEARVI